MFLLPVHMNIGPPWLTLGACQRADPFVCRGSVVCLSPVPCILLLSNYSEILAPIIQSIAVDVVNNLRISGAEDKAAEPFPTELALPIDEMEAVENVLCFGVRHHPASGQDPISVGLIDEDDCPPRVRHENLRPRAVFDYGAAATEGCSALRASHGRALDGGGICAAGFRAAHLLAPRIGLEPILRDGVVRVGCDHPAKCVDRQHSKRDASGHEVWGQGGEGRHVIDSARSRSRRLRRYFASSSRKQARQAVRPRPTGFVFSDVRS